MKGKFIALLLTKLGVGVGSVISSGNTIATNLRKLYGDDERIDIRVSRSLDNLTEIEINVADETTYITFKHNPCGERRQVVKDVIIGDSTK